MNKLSCFSILALLAQSAFGQRAVIADSATTQAQSAQTDLIQVSVMLQDQDSQSYREASPRDVFFDGQRFRLRVSASQAGYLYVLCENSQGSAVVLYPNQLSDATNHMQEARRVTVPGNSWFQFDQEPGVERIYVLLAERPLAELERASQRGGEISRRLLERYVIQDGRESKGIFVSADGDMVVRKVELRHETR